MAVELARDLSFGQYLNLGSALNRLDPRAKLLGFALLLTAALVISSFRGYAVLLVAALLIQRTSRIPLSYSLRGMRLLASTLLVVFVFQVLFFPNPRQPFWQWWLLSLSWDGLERALLILVRVLLLYYLTSTLLYTTALMDLADGTEALFGGLKRLRLPVHELVLVLIIALKFVPLLVAELERLIKAQAARGVRVDSGGPLQRARVLAGLLVPLSVGAFARAEVLATALDARCYQGGQSRSKLRLLRFARSDALALALAALFALASILVDRAL